MDTGQEHHHCVVVDADGERLLSRRVLNDETALLELIGDVPGLTVHRASASCRGEGKGHKQALPALARRRLNVLWAMIRDGACHQAAPSATAAA
ncbi:IS110 family transposase [Streptomyces sp. NPDC055058]